MWSREVPLSTLIDASKLINTVLSCCGYHINITVHLQLCQMSVYMRHHRSLVCVVHKKPRKTWRVSCQPGIKRARHHSMHSLRVYSAGFMECRLQPTRCGAAPGANGL